MEHSFVKVPRNQLKMNLHNSGLFLVLLVIVTCVLERNEGSNATTPVPASTTTTTARHTMTTPRNRSTTRTYYTTTTNNTAGQRGAGSKLMFSKLSLIFMSVIGVCVMKFV
ncbi:uncharacterized protein LOC134272006 [Saccostrea cucullata]|uniref:uncharacterized protein LOC134272006 n=1 Tax=Saccostrea cuccullata TaxID=36930 RepID=UPI002ED4ADBA